MAERSSFWNSAPGDVREYQAAEFAEYFSRFISDGIYVVDGNMGLKVTAGSGLKVNVVSGFAYIRGYLYKNDVALSKTLPVADGTLNRIDRVVLQMNEVNREIKVIIKSGGYGSSPIAPTLTNTTTIKELSLAQIRVNAGSTTPIITDERLSEFCGQVQLLIDIPMQDLLDEWNLWKQNNQTDFNDWLQGLEDDLDGVDVTMLLGLINGLENTKMDKTKIHLSNQNAVLSQMADDDIWIKWK